MFDLEKKSHSPHLRGVIPQDAIFEKVVWHRKLTKLVGATAKKGQVWLPKLTIGASLLLGSAKLSLSLGEQLSRSGEFYNFLGD